MFPAALSNGVMSEAGNFTNWDFGDAAYPAVAAAAFSAAPVIGKARKAVVSAACAAAAQGAGGWLTEIGNKLNCAVGNRCQNSGEALTGKSSACCKNSYCLTYKFPNAFNK